VKSMDTYHLKRSRLVNRAGQDFVLTNVKVDGALITGSLQEGKRVVLRRREVVRQRLVPDMSRRVREKAGGAPPGVGPAPRGTADRPGGSLATCTGSTHWPWEAI
jgi:hypothetical protein